MNLTRRADLALLALVLATLAAWILGEWSGRHHDLCGTHAAASGQQICLAGLLALLAAVKSQLIVREFMGLRLASWRWRLALATWLVLVLGLIGLAYGMSA